MEKKDNCFKCEHKREVPGDAHIQCANPDPEMKGHELGIRKGWFMYPFCFDPVWKAKECSNFKAKN